jgi:hypothetical protein
MSHLATTESLWLPPPDARLIDPNKEKIKTPVDERGLVIVGDLIDVVKETIDPDYICRGMTSIHHIYWPEAWYLHPANVDEVNAAAFRDLPIHKARLPRIFENWLHLVTLPPPKPSPEVMQYRLEAWEVAVDLFNTASGIVLNEKRMRRRAVRVANSPEILNSSFGGEDREAKRYFQEEFRSHLDGWHMHLQRLHNLPKEFRLIDPPDNPGAIATNLGKLVRPEALLLTRTVAA